MQDLLRQVLNPDEKLVWSGLPEKGIMFKPGDLLMIPFSLMWGGFAIFWEYQVLQHDAPGFFAWWGIPFVLIGLYMIFGRFFYDAKKRENTIYGLSNKRAIIISGVFGKKTTSVNLKNLPEVQVTQKSDGSGTIIFGANNPMQFIQNTGWPGARNMAPAFEGIENVQQVKKLIQQYQNT